MRLKITMNSDLGIRLPRGSQEIIHNFIIGHVKNFKKEFSNFCFSSPKGNFEPNSDKTITYYGEMSFFISSSDEDFIEELASSVDDDEMFNGQEVRIVGRQKFDFNVKFESYKVKTISPVTVYELKDNKTIFYNPEDPKFFEIIEKHINAKYQGAFDTKILIKDLANIKKVITRYKGFVVEAYQFDCLVKASKECLNAIYNDGIGNRTFQGFGMVLLGF